MRNFTSYTIATLFAATLLATPVLAADRGNHAKQAEPGYWTSGSAQSTDAAQPTRGMDPARQLSETKRTPLMSGGHRHGSGSVTGTEDNAMR